jgi:DNA integrity scanning protein DisA with diadenylate cyclase activity
MMENKNGMIELSEVMKDPEKAKQIEAFIIYAEKTPFSKMFPKKYELSVEQSVYDEVQALFVINPTTPLKSVVTTVLNSLDEDISADLLLKMTRLIIQEWESLSTAHPVEKDVAELV